MLDIVIRMIMAISNIIIISCKSPSYNCKCAQNPPTEKQKPAALPAWLPSCTLKKFKMNLVPRIN